MKLFLQLVAELKCLGAVIVHADFNTIIINTKKLTEKDAIGYVEYIFYNIKNKDIFHSININLSGVWELLLWKDSAYFGVHHLQTQKHY